MELRAGRREGGELAWHLGVSVVKALLLFLLLPILVTTGAVVELTGSAYPPVLKPGGGDLPRLPLATRGRQPSRVLNEIPLDQPQLSTAWMVASDWMNDPLMRRPVYDVKGGRGLRQRGL